MDTQSKSGSRSELELALQKYVSETYRLISKVWSFTDTSGAWERARMEEVRTMKRMQEQTNRSPDKDLQELGAVLEKTRRGLLDMEEFLDALEQLSVTSLQVFLSDTCKDLTSVCSIILTAQNLAPVLITFKRDNQTFFQPKLENVEILQMQLEMYIKELSDICVMFRDESLFPSRFCADRQVKGVAFKTTLEHMDLLSTIRNDADFRMLYLFRGREDTFTAPFTAYHSNMRQFLSNLESCAEQMEKMNKGANVSGVVHSSVATAGGVMSILGILAAPFTAGASLGLLAVGTGLGVASTVTSVVTDATELGVNETELQKAQKHFSEFMDEAQKIQSSLEKIIEQHFEALGADLMKENSKIAIKAAMGGKNIHKTLKYIKKFRALRAGQLSGAGLRAAGQTGKALMKGAFALVSVGWGIYSIVDHSKNLSKGPETEASRWIRARVALWRSELDSWEKMCHRVNRGQKVSSKYEALLKEHHLS